MALARAEGLFDADLAGALLHADQHDVHQADAGDAERERSDEEQQGLQAERDDAELRELLHDVGDVDGVVVGGAEAVRCGEGRCAAACCDRRRGRRCSSTRCRRCT